MTMATSVMPKASDKVIRRAQAAWIQLQATVDPARRKALEATIAAYEADLIDILNEEEEFTLRRQTDQRNRWTQTTVHALVTSIPNQDI